MPLIGLAIGRPLGTAIGNAADYLAIGVLLALALHMLIGEEERDLGSLLGRGALGSVALAVSVSLDELAIGFTLGLLRVPIVPVIVLIALQAFVVSQLGMRLGERIGERAREGAERLAGAALALLAIGLLVAKLAGKENLELEDLRASQTVALHRGVWDIFGAAAGGDRGV